MPLFRIVVLLLTLGLSAVAQTNGVPFVSQPLIPASVTPGSSGFTMTVNGNGFASGAQVFWNGSVRATTFISSRRLHAIITAADIATANTASVTVQNPAPGGGTSSAIYFPIGTAPTMLTATGKNYPAEARSAGSPLVILISTVKSI